jgi:hypothetical protein
MIARDGPIWKAARVWEEATRSYSASWVCISLTADHPRENRCSCLQTGLRNPLVAVWVGRYWVAKRTTNES